MFDFHRFMLYNIFFYALKRLFEKDVYKRQTVNSCFIRGKRAGYRLQQQNR